MGNHNTHTGRIGHQDLRFCNHDAHTTANIMSMTPRPPDQRQMALNVKIARNTQLSSPSKNRRRPMARHKKKQSTIQHVCLLSQDLNKKTSTQISLTTSNKTHKHRSDAHRRGRTQRQQNNDDHKPHGSRHALRRRRHCTGATVLHQRDKTKRSSAGRQQSRSARSPQNAKKAVQQREPDLHHHRTLTETTTRTQNRLGTKTFSPKKKNAHTVANIMCMTPRPPD